MSLIINAEDEAPVISLKEKLAEVAPLSKRSLFEKRPSSFKKVNPKDLYENLNQKVIGQENAKKRISIAVFEHMRNIVHHRLNDKQNILFLGPSGSGKTLIVNTISNYLDVPYVSGDATSFSPTGFQGSDADSVITDLLIKSNGEPGLAEKGVVFIDEIDKLASNMSAATRLESFHYSTQSTLLKLIEGKKVKVSSAALGEQGTPPVVVDTSSILFCFGGAFNGLEKIVAKKLGLTEGTIGFRKTKSADYESQVKNYEIYNQASHEILAESLIEYGMSTEFVGRIQSIVPLVPLTKEQMLYCLLQLEDSPILRSQIMFAESNVKLEFDENYYEEVVEKAIKSGTGTRALNSIVKASLSGAAFELLGSSHSETKKVFIGKDCVSNPSAYVVE
jgi:ATP-dependent Clp protease ATP-binding subunit ClpX